MRVSITIMRQWNQINDAISEEWKLNIIAAMSCESKGRLCFNHIFMTEKREVLHCTLALWYHTIIHHILGLNALTRIYPERALGQPEIVLEARNWESGDCAVKNPEHQSIFSNPETGERKCLPVKYKQVFFFSTSKIMHAVCGLSLEFRIFTILARYWHRKNTFITSNHDYSKYSALPNMDARNLPRSFMTDASSGLLAVLLPCSLVLCWLSAFAFSYAWSEWVGVRISC